MNPVPISFVRFYPDAWPIGERLSDGRFERGGTAHHCVVAVDECQCLGKLGAEGREVTLVHGSFWKKGPCPLEHAIDDLRPRHEHGAHGGVPFGGDRTASVRAVLRLFALHELPSPALDRPFRLGRNAFGVTPRRVQNGLGRLIGGAAQFGIEVGTGHSRLSLLLA